MSKTIKIQSTKNGFKVVKTKAIANEKYIIADETGKPLNKLKFVQKNKNLEIYAEVDGKEQQVVTLEDYYAPDMNASVVGLSETNEELAYVYNENDGWYYLLNDTELGFVFPLVGIGAAGAAGAGPEPEKPACGGADTAGNSTVPSGAGGERKMMQNEMIHTDRVLIVEGKYDAVRLAHLTDAMILLTDGFGIYKDKKRQQLFKALAQKNGLILLTDSDAAGFRIRTYITNLVGAENVVQAYVPAIHGKEKRKPQPGKEGLLGVEGVDDAIVLQCLRDALGAEAGAAPARPEGRQITYTDLYNWGLSGTPGSAERKYQLLNALGLPPRLSKKELVEALNRLYSFEQLDTLQAEILEAQ